MRFEERSGMKHLPPGQPALCAHMTALRSALPERCQQLGNAGYKVAIKKIGRLVLFPAMKLGQGDNELVSIQLLTSIRASMLDPGATVPTFLHCHSYNDLTKPVSDQSSLYTQAVGVILNI